MVKDSLIGICICMLLFGSTVLPITGITSSEKTSQSVTKGEMLYVGGVGPNNYTKIQDAVNASSDGDTIFVYKGTYYEHIRVDKAIFLLGEDMGSTIIDGGGNGSVVKIGANVTISKFTIQQSGHLLNHDAGIINFVPNEKPYTIHIVGNCIKGNKNGVVLQNVHNARVTGNIFLNNDLGVSLFLASDCTINQNNFINNTNQSFFEYFFFLQIFPHNNWNGNYWDTWHSKLPKPIKGTKELILFVLRPGAVYTIPVKWINFDWHPALESYDVPGGR